MCRWLSAAGKVPALPRASDPRAEPTHRATARTPKRPLTEQPTEISAARGAAAKQSCAVTPDSSEAFPDLGTRPVGAALPRSTRRASPAAPTHTAPASRRDGAPDSTVRRSPALRARGPRAARQKHLLKGEEGEAAPRPPLLRPGSSRCAALRGPGRGPSARPRARDRPRERRRGPIPLAGTPRRLDGDRAAPPSAPARGNRPPGGRSGRGAGAEARRRPRAYRPQGPRPPPSPAGRGSPRCPLQGSPHSATRPWRRRPHKARRHGRGTRSRPPRQGRGRPRAGHAGTPRCGAPCRTRARAGRRSYGGRQRPFSLEERPRRRRGDTVSSAHPARLRRCGAPWRPGVDMPTEGAGSALPVLGERRRQNDDGGWQQCFWDCIRPLGRCIPRELSLLLSVCSHRTKEVLFSSS